MENINISVVFNAINKTAATFDKVSGQMGRITTCMWKMNQMSELWGKMSDTMGQISAPGIALEKSMAELSAITGIAGNDLIELEKRARSVGKSSGLGATGAVEAYKLLASQIDVSKIGMDGLNVLQDKTITLARASGLSLADSANALAGTINQFGLDANQADRVIQSLAAGAKYGAAEVPDLAQSFKVAGASAAAAGLSVEQTGGALETLSKMNLKGSESGTALRNVLLKMQTELGFDFKVTKLSDALKTLQGREGDAAYMAKLFGAENIAAAQFLVKNADGVDEMTSRMTNTTVATEQAAIMNATFAHRMDVTKAKLNDLAIGFYSNNQGIMQMVQMGGQGAQMLTSLAPLGSFAAQGFGVLAKGAAGAVNGIGNIGKASGLMKAAMAAGKLDTYTALIGRYGFAGKIAAGGIKISELATGAWNKTMGFAKTSLVPVIASTWAWTAALLANPITWIVVGVAALIAGLALAWKHFDGFRGAVVGAWEGIKQFGVILWQSIIDPLKQMLSGIGKIGQAIGLLFKGKFGDAWDVAKSGIGDMAGAAVKASPVGVAMQVVSRRQEIKDKAAAGYQKGKAIDTSNFLNFGAKKDKGKPETGDRGTGDVGKNFFGGLPKQGLAKPMEVPAGVTVPGVKIANADRSATLSGMSIPGTINANAPVIPKMNIPGQINAAQPTMKVVKAPGMISPMQVPPLNPLKGTLQATPEIAAVPSMNIPGQINANAPVIPKMNIPGTINAAQPNFKVAKAPGMISPISMPQPAGVTVPGEMAMNAPSVPGMNIPGRLQVSPAGKPAPVTIPGTIDAKQPEAKPMDIPGNVIMNVQSLQVLNFMGAIKFAQPEKLTKPDSTKATGGLDVLTRNITTNIQKSETHNSQANTTNNDSQAKIQVTYSPQINVSSNMDAKAKDDLMKMLADNKDELIKLFNEEMRRTDRLKYAG